MSGAGLRWLRLALKALLTILVFALEVRVHARTEEPEGCWKKEGPCALRSGGDEILRLPLAGGELVLDEATTVVRLAKDQLRVLAGTAWVRAEEPLSVTSEFGEYTLAKGEFWITRTRERVTGSTVSGTLVMRPRSKDAHAAEELEIPAGLENWMGRVQAGTGKAQTGVPMPIPLKSHLSRWARLFKGTREQFAAQAESFFEIWSLAARDSAEIHQKLVERKLAALDAERARKAEVSRQVEVRNRELIEIFRQRVFGP